MIVTAKKVLTGMQIKLLTKKNWPPTRIGYYIHLPEMIFFHDFFKKRIMMGLDLHKNDD